MRWLLLVVAACGGSQSLGPEGSTVTLRGRISDSPKQAFEQGIPGKVVAHFDYATDSKVVIYWTSAPTCPGEIEIMGTVKMESGPNKGGTKMNHERVVDVFRARCID
jgi:hypothetical protein